MFACRDLTIFGCGGAVAIFLALVLGVQIINNDGSFISGLFTYFFPLILPAMLAYVYAGRGYNRQRSTLTVALVSGVIGFVSFTLAYINFWLSANASRWQFAEFQGVCFPGIFVICAVIGGVGHLLSKVRAARQEPAT